MAEMQVKVGAEVSGAIAGLNEVQNELNQTGKAAAALGNEMQQASAKILKLPSVVNKATFTLNNFTRVVQDAPYGIRGVANNIDPLVESFSQLRSQTGSTALAFRSMVSALAGPAGIALAISTVSTLLVQYGDKLFQSSAAAKANAQANKELAESFSAEFVQLTSLVGLAQNNAATQEDRRKALAALNQEYGKYLPSLQQEGINLGNINESYKAITETLLNQAVVRGLQSEIAKEVEKVAVQIINIIKLRERDRIGLNQTTKETKTAISAEQALENAIARKNAIVTDGFIAQNKQNQATKAALGTTDTYGNIIANLKDELFKTVAPALQLANSFDLIGKSKPEKFKFDFGFIPNLELQMFRLAYIFLPAVRDAAKQIQKDLAKEDKLPKRFNLDLDIDEQSRKFQKLLKENGQAAERSINTINEAFLNIQLEGLYLIGETIGQLLVNGDIQKGFLNFGNVIASGLEIIGKELIKIGGLTELVQKALSGLFGPQGGPLAIAAGIGLITAAAALRASLANGIPGRALGGPVSGGTPYIVGERGPELFVPQVSGGIVPNNSVGSFMSGRMGDSGRGSVLRGQDIILAYARTQRSQLRVNG